MGDNYNTVPRSLQSEVQLHNFTSLPLCVKYTYNNIIINWILKLVLRPLKGVLLLKAIHKPQWSHTVAFKAMIDKNVWWETIQVTTETPLQVTTQQNEKCAVRSHTSNHRKVLSVPQWLSDALQFIVTIK